MKQHAAAQVTALRALRLKRWHTLAVYFVRVVVLMLTAELSGGVHAAVDLAVATGLVEHPHDDCERDGHDCPPGCPSCHCAHGTAACNAPVLSLLDGVMPPLCRSVARPFRAARIPASPERARVDRPPRPSAHNS